MILRQRFKMQKYTWDDVNTKIQNKEANLKQCQGKDSRQESKSKNNVKAKIQDKEISQEISK